MVKSRWPTSPISPSASGREAFYQAGDLELYSGKDELLMTLPGVPRPRRFRQIILDARAARLQSDASLNVIRARG